MNEQRELASALDRIKRADTAQKLHDLRVHYLGRKGLVTSKLKAVGELPEDKRKEAGEDANRLRTEIAKAIEAAAQRIQNRRLEAEFKEINLDVTAPAGSPPGFGHFHPVTALVDEAVKIFWQMGFSVIDGPEIETEWYNFEALNMPADHPARDMQDTFYLEGGNLPRTHTSNLQIRYMEDNKPPIRVIAPGKVYRNEDEDSRHVWMFHQIEGLVVDKGVTLADLKGTLLAMTKGLLGQEAGVRLRPSFFPYTEPSVEMDATCVVCGGRGGGCKTCSGTGWLELGGAGMVHPKVLSNVGIDPAVYSGFAFGFGPERIAAIKYNVPDVREFWRPDLKFLEQF